MVCSCIVSLRLISTPFVETLILFLLFNVSAKNDQTPLIVLRTNCTRRRSARSYALVGVSGHLAKGRQCGQCACVNRKMICLCSHVMSEYFQFGKWSWRNLEYYVGGETDEQHRRLSSASGQSVQRCHQFALLPILLSCSLFTDTMWTESRMVEHRHVSNILYMLNHRDLC